jgi:hypothetical protein
MLETQSRFSKFKAEYKEKFCNELCGAECILLIVELENKFLRDLKNNNNQFLILMYFVVDVHFTSLALVNVRCVTVSASLVVCLSASHQ